MFYPHWLNSTGGSNKPRVNPDPSSERQCKRTARPTAPAAARPSSPAPFHRAPDTGLSDHDDLYCEEAKRKELPIDFLKTHTCLRI